MKIIYIKKYIYRECSNERSKDESNRSGIINFKGKKKISKVMHFVTVGVHSPVVLRLKVADRDEPSTTANCKLVLQWRPLHKSGCSVDPEDDQRRLPYSFLLGPYVSVTICSTSYYTVTFGSPVNTYNNREVTYDQNISNLLRK